MVVGVGILVLELWRQRGGALVLTPRHVDVGVESWEKRRQAKMQHKLHSGLNTERGGDSVALDIGVSQCNSTPYKALGQCHEGDEMSCHLQSNAKVLSVCGALPSSSITI